MAQPSTECVIAAESKFGPIVSSACNGGFDFTLLFEETILSVVPSVIAAGLLLTRLTFLARRKVNVHYGRPYVVKIVRGTFSHYVDASTVANAAANTVLRCYTQLS